MFYSSNYALFDLFQTVSMLKRLLCKCSTVSKLSQTLLYAAQCYSHAGYLNWTIAST
jgi:hypothetical protein